MTELSLTAVRSRQQVIKLVRRFFDSSGFEEVTTASLSGGVPLEPTIYPFTTAWTGVQPNADLYLPISPEREMKRLLAEGLGDCYTIGHCFRNLEGKGETHHPEFLMLEWYRVGATYQQIMDDTLELINFVASGLVSKLTGEAKTQALNVSRWSWQKLSVAQLWEERLGVPLAELLEDEKMTRFARRLGYQAGGSTWEQNYNQIFLNEIEPHLPTTPFFLLDFPARLSPLCAPKVKEPWLAERFEVYLRGMEVGNGNSEHLDAQAVQQAFAMEKGEREAQGVAAPPVDEVMLAAIARMSETKQQYAGIGLGIERLTMALTSIADLGEFYGEFPTTS